MKSTPTQTTFAPAQRQRLDRLYHVNPDGTIGAPVNEALYCQRCAAAQVWRFKQRGVEVRAVWDKNEGLCSQCYRPQWEER